MHKDLFWTGHILSGNTKLLKQFQQTIPTLASNVGKAAVAAANQQAGAPSPDPDGLRKGWIYVCALKVTASHFKIDANDPGGSLSASIDWSNAAVQQAAVMSIYINQEAPAIADHDAPQYQLVWANIDAASLTASKTVADVFALIQSHYS